MQQPVVDIAKVEAVQLFPLHFLPSSASTTIPPAATELQRGFRPTPNTKGKKKKTQALKIIVTSQHKLIIIFFHQRVTFAVLDLFIFLIHENCTFSK